MQLSFSDDLGSRDIPHIVNFLTTNVLEALQDIQITNVFRAESVVVLAKVSMRVWGFLRDCDAYKFLAFVTEERGALHIRKERV